MSNTTAPLSSITSPSRYFPAHSLESAPLEVVPFLQGAQQKFGFIPLATARHASAPAVVEGFGQLLQLFAKTSLSELEREALALALAGKFDCKLCRDLHRRLAMAAGASNDEVAALIARQGIGNPRLSALVLFAERVVETRGAVPDDDMDAFIGAGFTARQALEVVFGIATYTLSIFANRLTRVETIR